MTRRGVFIADGSSDLPMGIHLERLCARCGLDVTITVPDPARLPQLRGPVRDRLEYLRRTGEFNVYFVHRDAEGQDPERRRLEILEGATAAHVPRHFVVPVVPVRMTEAWLLLDEEAIRRLAGKPSGTGDLGLPQRSRVERARDPKKTLRDAIVVASGAKGRRLKRIKDDFNAHRSQLLRRLDIDGPLTELPSWQRLLNDVEALAAYVHG